MTKSFVARPADLRAYMRILHTTEPILKESFDDNALRYAILLHRLEDEEIDLRDFVAIRNLGKPEY